MVSLISERYEQDAKDKTFDTAQVLALIASFDLLLLRKAVLKQFQILELAALSGRGKV